MKFLWCGLSSLVVVIFCTVAYASEVTETYQASGESWSYTRSETSVMYSGGSYSSSGVSSSSLLMCCCLSFCGGFIVCPAAVAGLILSIITFSCKDKINAANDYNQAFCLWVNCDETQWPGCIKVPCFFVDMGEQSFVQCGDLAKGDRNITAAAAYGLPLSIVNSGVGPQFFKKSLYSSSCPAYNAEDFSLFYKPYCTKDLKKKVSLQAQKQVVQKLIEQKARSQRPQHYRKTMTRPRQFRKK